MRLTLGPVLYAWPRERLLAFYEEAADWPVDTVCLGEIVCEKRRVLNGNEWLTLGERLAAAGKEVLLSTPVLIESEATLRRLRRLCENDRFLVEANDMSAVHLLAGGGRPFAGGPGLNVYNPRTLAVLAERGLCRWSAPPELPQAALAAVHAQRPRGVHTEVFAFGRVPLAHSARCFTARAENRQKDRCGKACFADPDGRLLHTQDGQPVLVLNGIQTQSAHTLDLLPQLEALRRLGVERLRISPQSTHTATVVRAFRAALDGADPGECAARLNACIPVGPCDGFWHGAPGAGCRGAVD
ncbi:MAG: U32 family peptidase [Gammaproteobacteria bacterium]|nr:MAG: U32 family peptidase [Gammaproteobacteria bacterium]